MQDSNLDEFIMENGTELKNDIQVLSKEETDKKFENNFQILYDNDKPIPGNNVTNKISGLEDINEQTALDSLIIKSAMIKAEKEKAEEDRQRKKLTKKDREAVKKQFVDSLMYQQEEDYYQKHHYVMDGKTKRGTRKRIERDFDKGRYDKFLMQDRKTLNG